ncbi:MAG TPA: hypothetical protein VND62_06680 [Acidimicrobiales bacterium]|nr:hypothetical protein [Acidimicrobiales bacterium]
MSRDLATYLDAIDARIDADHEVDLERSDDDLREVRRCAVALLRGTMIPEKVHEDWPDFFRLVLAVVLAHGSLRLCHLQQESSLFEGWGDDPLTDYDRVFLETFMDEVDGVLDEGGVCTHGGLARREVEGTR